MLVDEDTHISFVLIALGLGLLSTVVLSATCITSEKESRSWPLLLATTLDNRAILIGKWAGILRRCLPAWIWLFGHVIIFSLAGFIHPVAILQIGCMAIGTLIFLSGSGLYFLHGSVNPSDPAHLEKTRIEGRKTLDGSGMIQ